MFQTTWYWWFDWPFSFNETYWFGFLKKNLNQVLQWILRRLSEHLETEENYSEVLLFQGTLTLVDLPYTDTEF